MNCSSAKGSDLWWKGTAMSQRMFDEQREARRHELSKQFPCGHTIYDTVDSVSRDCSHLQQDPDTEELDPDEVLELERKMSLSDNEKDEDEPTAPTASGTPTNRVRMSQMSQMHAPRSPKSASEIVKTTLSSRLPTTPLTTHHQMCSFAEFAEIFSTLPTDNDNLIPSSYPDRTSSSTTSTSPVLTLFGFPKHSTQSTVTPFPNVPNSESETDKNCKSQTKGVKFNLKEMLPPKSNVKSVKGKDSNKRVLVSREGVNGDVPKLRCYYPSVCDQCSPKPIVDPSTLRWSAPSDLVRLKLMIGSDHPTLNDIDCDSNGGDATPTAGNRVRSSSFDSTTAPKRTGPFDERTTLNFHDLSNSMFGFQCSTEAETEAVTSSQMSSLSNADGGTESEARLQAIQKMMGATLSIIDSIPDNSLEVDPSQFKKITLQLYPFGLNDAEVEVVAKAKTTVEAKDALKLVTRRRYEDLKSHITFKTESGSSFLSQVSSDQANDVTDGDEGPRYFYDSI